MSKVQRVVDNQAHTDADLVTSRHVTNDTHFSLQPFIPQPPNSNIAFRQFDKKKGDQAQDFTNRTDSSCRVRAQQAFPFPMYGNFFEALGSSRDRAYLSSGRACLTRRAETRLLYIDTTWGARPRCTHSPLARAHSRRPTCIYLHFLKAHPTSCRCTHLNLDDDREVAVYADHLAPHEVRLRLVFGVGVDILVFHRLWQGQNRTAQEKHRQD